MPESRFYWAPSHSLIVGLSKGNVHFQGHMLELKDPVDWGLLENSRYYGKHYWRVTKDGVPVDEQTGKPVPSDRDRVVQVEMDDGTKRALTHGQIAAMLSKQKAPPRGAEAEPVEEEAPIPMSGKDFRLFRERMDVTVDQMAELLDVEPEAVARAERAARISRKMRIKVEDFTREAEAKIEEG